MNVSSRVLRAALMSVWATCSASVPPLPLRDALVNQVVTSRAMVQNGSLASNSSNGHMTAFSNFGAGRITALEVMECWVYLVEEYDRAVGEVVAGSTDMVIEAQMESNLRPTYGYTNNWMYASK